MLVGHQCQLDNLFVVGIALFYGFIFNLNKAENEQKHRHFFGYPSS